MIKVMWFLKRADHLLLQVFLKWWVEVHALVIAEAQKNRLRKYVIGLRWLNDTLPDKPPTEIDWDGCAEQWFETEADFEAVYGPPTPGPMRTDAVSYVSRRARMVVRESLIQTAYA